MTKPISSTAVLLAIVISAHFVWESQSFVIPPVITQHGRDLGRAPTGRLRHYQQQQQRHWKPLLAAIPNGAKDSPELVLDNLLESGDLRGAIRLLQQQEQDNESPPPIELSRERWQKIFDAIELRTAQADENMIVPNDNTHKQQQRVLAEYPPVSPARMDMTDMYNVLQQQDHLRLFGAVPSEVMPASGSHSVTPTLLEQITSLDMKALTPQPTPTLLLAGTALALVEGLLSAYLGWDWNALVLITLLAALVDRLVLNGAVLESYLQVFSPGISKKIVQHEAGHFLCAYLLGCPVEGCVLSAWAALQDARFGSRQVSAGTSFFDPRLSQEMNSAARRVTRSSVDRYSIIVMGGIAAEAMMFGRADGGAGDEMALIAFLSQLNQDNSRNTNSPAKTQWNDGTIRNQARWGALQAVLMLKQYKPCYDALVDALERGGNLGDCIYAIEKAGRENELSPLKQPIGYILEEGPYGVWTNVPPAVADDAGATTATTVGSRVMAMPEPAKKVEPMNEEEKASTILQELQEYRQQMEARVRDIDERLKSLE